MPRQTYKDKGRASEKMRMTKGSVPGKTVFVENLLTLQDEADVTNISAN